MPDTLRLKIFLPILALLTPGLLLADLTPYSARYSLYKNGKLMGKTEIDLVQQSDKWVVTSESRGTHGLARLLKFRDDEQVIGRVDQGRFIPEQYQHDMSVAGMSEEWTGHFNWPDQVAEVLVKGEEPLQLELTPGTVDPLSLKLEMRRRLDQPEPQLDFPMLEEEAIEIQQFRLLPEEWMETSLGCFKTRPLEKVRRSKSRYTRAWHAEDLGNIEVRVEHGKTGGDHYELRISNLVLNGEPVEPRPGCALRQGNQDS